MELKKEKESYIHKIENATEEEIKNRSFSFSLFSANVKKFLPDIADSDYQDLFKKFLYFKWSSGIEQYSMDYLRKSTIINYSSIDLHNLQQNDPLIFGSFHFGSFRLYNSILFELGHKIVIIIDENIVKKQKDDLLLKVKPLLKAKDQSDFVILSVQNRESIFKLKKYISEGYVMSVYLDGNAGVHNKKQDFTKGYSPIKFLGQEIFIKNGIPKLSSILGAKIIPVISYRDSNENSTVEFHKEIYIKDYSNKQEFIDKSLQDTFNILEKKLIDYPAQFTSWVTVQDMFSRNDTTPYENKDPLLREFNSKRYSLFSLGKSYFLFDLLDYQSYPITNELANSIKNNTFNNIDKKLESELIYKNIII
jgi:lauroyl/myristoyl acyltransferase